MNLSALESDLKRLVGDRATVSRFERWFYARDIVHIPGAIRRLFRTVSAAVVRPASAEQVSAVLRYCRERGLPVTPRGAGSSGLFGAVPKRGGVVLDLLDLSHVESVDADQETATAGAGTTWWRLEKELGGHGLTLRSYPSSALSATLAGWVVTSGLGIGSLKYGPVFDHVLSAEVVLPDGTVREVSEEDMERFWESEGILGVITRLTVRVRRLPEAVGHHLLYFADIGALFTTLERLVRDPARPYNVEFQDSGYLALLRAGGCEVGDFGPGGGLLLVTYDGDREEVEQAGERLSGLCAELGGERRDGAEREWEQRFNMLRVKRAVPTILPSSVYVSLDRVGQFYSGLGRLRKRSLGLLGYLVSEGQCSLMPMIPTDQHRPAEYLFALQTPGAVSNLALSVGGRPGGGTGVWNAAYRISTLGAERMAELRKAKQELDPANIMNPGMWPEPPLLFRPAPYRLLTGLASRLDRLLPTRRPRPVEQAGFRKELADCVQCGYCMSVCPTAQGWLSSTPRGRILMARERFLDGGVQDAGRSEYLERLYQCTMCGRCGVGCSVDIRARPMWQGLRRHLVEKGLKLDRLGGLTATISETHNMAGKPNGQRGNWVSRLKLPYDLKEKRRAEVVYFVGCVTSFFPMAQPAARAFAQIMELAGVDFAIAGGDEWCCGFPLMAAGDGEAAVACVRHNVERIRATGASTLVITCPGCYRVWKEEYLEVIEDRHGFEVLHGTELVARLLEDGRIKPDGLEAVVTYHDPCDLGRNSGIFEEPRYIMGRIPGLDLVELEESRERCSCCGSGGDLLASNQEMAMDIAARKVDEALATGTDILVTACPSCVRAISMARTSAKVKLSVLDINEVVLKAMGS